jgi:CubicO group peptidase (beta-lactamase class C family)
MHKSGKRVFILLAAISCCGVSAPTKAETFEWQTVAPNTVGLDRAPLDKLAKRINANPEFNIHSVLIVKDGKLAFEAYFSGNDQDWGTDLGNVTFDSDTRHDLRSVSKSVTSALIGIAIDDGKLAGTDATVPELFPEYADHIAPDKRDLTLEHMLTMTAGLSWFEPLDYTNPGNDEIRMINSPDPVAFVLGRSFATKPGERFQYNGGLPTLLGYLLEKAYGKPGDVIAREVLLGPLGIDDFDFRANRNGLLAYASGMRLTPRDMARLGLLYLNEGEWQGQQLLPKKWVTDSLKSHIQSTRTFGYGYQWWINRFDSPEASMKVPTARGNGGQRIFILEPLNMVVVITAGNYNMGNVPLSGVRILEESIFPAAGLVGMKVQQVGVK